MRFLLCLPLLTVLIAAAPYSSDEEKVVISLEDYPEHLVIYEGKHDIVDIIVPMNAASETDSSESNSSEDLKKHLMVFFLEADFEDGRRIDRGVYVYKDGKATKLMDSGSAIAASADDSFYVFIGAEDGLHAYDPKTAKVNKYGTFDYSIKDMAKETNTDTIYILTDDRVLYKVYDAATLKEEVEDVKNAEHIMIDYSNNLYFYGDDKKPYVRNVHGEIKEIEGLPETAGEVRFFRPPALNSEGVEFLVDNEMYTLYPNGKSEASNFAFTPDAKPTAYSMEAVFFRYFGFNKKIYEYDFFSMFGSLESNEQSKES